MILTLALAVALCSPLPPPTLKRCVTSETTDARLRGRTIKLFDLKPVCEEWETECVSDAHSFCRPISVSLGFWDPMPRDPEPYRSYP